MTRRERAYNKMIEDLTQKALSLEGAAIERVLRILENMRQEIGSRIAATDWQAHYLPELKNAIAQATDRFRQQYRLTQQEATAASWNLGVDEIDAPLAAAGVWVSAPEIPLSLLGVLQGYSADLIEGLSADALKKINSEITMGVLGQKPVYQVMEAIGKNLDEGIVSNISARAQTITRTEMAHVQSAAREARIQALQKGMTEPRIRLKKKWIWSGSAHPRPWHQALNGVEVDIDQNFPGNIPYPHAPGLPAKEVINCGCTHVISSPDWGDLPDTWDQMPYLERAA